MSNIPKNTRVPQLHPMQMKHDGKPTRLEPAGRLRDRANPFIPSGGSNLWHRNELLLQDQALRTRSGVVQIDESLTRGYNANPEKSRY